MDKIQNVFKLLRIIAKSFEAESVPSITLFEDQSGHLSYYVKDAKNDISFNDLDELIFILVDKI